MKKSNKEDNCFDWSHIWRKGHGQDKKDTGHGKSVHPVRKGNTIFIDDDTSYIYDLSTKARFINASDYGITTPKMLYGFLCGLAASDFDLEAVYIDGLLRIIGHELDSLEGLFDDLKSFSAKHNLNIIMSVTGSKETVPAFLRPTFSKENDRPGQTQSRVCRRLALRDGLL
jgi:hypothetical protein